MPTLIGEKREGRGKIRQRRGMPVYEGTFHYLVEAESIHQEREDVLLLTSGLPKVGETTTGGGFSVCVSLDADRRKEKPTYWDVTAEFSSEVDEQSGGSTNPSVNPPETWVPIYETKFERKQKVVTKDASGDPFVNSAGQPFETGLTRTRHIPVWEFFQFEPATLTDEAVLARTEVVNSTTFKGRAAKTLLCVVLSSVIGRYYGQLRRLTQYQLKYDKDTWQIEMLDVGTMHWNNANTAMVPYQVKILSSGGFTADNLETILGPLDGTGGQPAGGYDGTTDFALMDGTATGIIAFDEFTTIDFHTFLRI